MVETPALISRPRVHAGIATLAMILAIVGIFIPYVGILLGIAAIVIGIVALHLKTTNKGPAIVGIVVGAFAVLAGLVFALIVSLIVGHASYFSLFPPSDRDKAVTAQLNEKKDFTQNETAKMGPVNIKITSVQQNYTPTPEEVAATKGINPNEILPSADQYNQGTTLAEDEVEYVLVQGTEQVNGGEYLGDNDLDIDYMSLNNVTPYAYTGGLNVDRYKTAAPTTPSDFSYVYRIRKGSDKLVLSRKVTIWKSISPIVGTEGAPRAYLTYTITLN